MNTFQIIGLIGLVLSIVGLLSGFVILALVLFGVIDRDPRRKVRTFCPVCNTEGSLLVSIDTSGVSPSKYGPNYWVEGDGKCLHCGWRGPFSDSTH